MLWNSDPDIVEQLITKTDSLDSNFSIKNLILTTIHGKEMLDNKKVSYYDDSKKGEKVSFEMHVNFKDVIALRICNQPFYKLITYTEQISTLKHLKD